MLEFNLNLPPVSWSAHKGYGKRSYNPKQKERDQYQLQFLKQYTLPFLLNSPLRIEFTFQFAYPKSYSKKKITQIQEENNLHTIRPDATNLQKFLEDALKGVVISDDSIVHDIRSIKRFGKENKVNIKIYQTNEEV